MLVTVGFSAFFFFFLFEDVILVWKKIVLVCWTLRCFGFTYSASIIGVCAQEDGQTSETFYLDLIWVRVTMTSLRRVYRVACACMYVGVYFLVCVYQCRVRRSIMGVFLLIAWDSLFCESDVSHFALDWLVIETVSSSLHPPCAGVIGTHCQAHCFCTGMWGFWTLVLSLMEW